jgi:hypothetical protein
MRFILILMVLFGPALAQGQAQTDPQIDPPSQQKIVEVETEAQAPAPSPLPMPELAEQPALATATSSPETLAPGTMPAAAPEIQLFELLASKDQLLDIQEQLVAALVSANPALDGYQLILRDWAHQYLSQEELREGMARVYRSYFTPREIEEMIAFYRSPTGRKSVLLMPTLFQEGSQIGMQLAQAHKDELIDMLRQADEQKQALSPTPNGLR